RREERKLPEARLLGPPARTEHAAIGGARALDEDLDAATRQAATHGRLVRITVALRDEQMTDGEPTAAHEARFVARGAEDVRPESARDIGEDAGAVAFAVDETRAVRE